MRRRVGREEALYGGADHWLSEGGRYLRSSKDRHDVSIDAQREELLRVAAARGLTVAREFTDVVESAKDEHRPAFQELRAALADRNRDWTTVLLLEPSRLSRNQYVAH